MTAPGRKAWESSIVVLPDGLTMALPAPNLALADGSSPPDEPGDTADPGASEEHPAPRSHEAAGGPGAQATAAVALAGVGALGIVVGTAAGLVSISKHNESNNGCTNNVCSPEAGAARDGAIHAGNWSTAAFTVGIIAGAAGVVLWVTKPSPDRARSSRAAPSASLAIAPLLAPGMAGTALQGRW
jgi:hypothetical protein